jgi:hypothetical protein
MTVRRRRRSALAPAVIADHTERVGIAVTPSKKTGRLDTPRWSVLALLSLGLIAGGRVSGIAAQEVVRVTEDAACQCEMQAELQVTLSDMDGRAGLARPLVVSRTPDDHYLVVPDIDQSVVLDFDAEGAFVGRVGRKGQGPEELFLVMDIERGPADSLIVLDSGNNRIAALPPGLHPTRVARTTRLPVGGGQLGVLDDGDFVVLDAIHYGGGDRLHVVDPEGRLVRSFMPNPPVSRSGAAEQIPRLRRRMSARPDGLIAVSHNTEYTVEIWDASGEHLKTLDRAADWFPRYEDRGRDGEPTANLYAVHLDSAGRVWTLVQVPDANWRDAPELRGGLLPGGPPPVVMDRRYDSIVEVMDPETGRLLASSRVDSMLTQLLSDGYAASYWQDEIGNPFVDIWRFDFRDSGAIR